MHYGPHERQQYWVHPDSQPQGNWLIVIHGGLWRDPSVTHKTGHKLANDMKKHFNGVATISYRLSPEIVHPEHRNDCSKAVQAIINAYNPSSLVFIGHSAGCYLAGQLTPEFSPAQVIGLEGLYDLDELVLEYPSLEPMIRMAFPGSWLESRPDWATVPLSIVHSTEDELVSMRQPEFACSLRPNTKLFADSNGTHNYVFEKSDLEPRILQVLNIKLLDNGIL